MKNFIENINEINSTTKGKAALFFFAFVLFLVFIGIFSRTVGTTNPEEYYNTVTNDSSWDSLLKANYRYKYNINVDGVETLIEGKINESEETFTITIGEDKKDYYRNIDGFLVNTDGTWIKCDNPNNYSKFTNIDYVDKLVKNSSFTNKTDYDSGKVIYNFQITTNSINELLDGNITDYDDVPSEINVIFKADNNIDHVNFKFSNYCRTVGTCENNLDIKLEYYDIGKIDDIKNPISINEENNE